MHTIDPRAIVHLPVSGKTELLFLLFHGVGGQASNMAPLAAALRDQYPQAAIVSLNGPDAFDGMADAGGFQWFSALGVTDMNRGERVDAAMPAFIARVRAWAAHFALDWPMVALGGFSQGAIMALEAVQAEANLAGRVIAVGSRYAYVPQHAPQGVCIHLLHGTADHICPPAGAQALHQALPHSRLQWVAGAGHDPSHPAMAAAMLAALQQAESTGGFGGLPDRASTADAATGATP